MMLMAGKVYENTKGRNADNEDSRRKRKKNTRIRGKIKNTCEGVAANYNNYVNLLHGKRKENQIRFIPLPHSPTRR